MGRAIYGGIYEPGHPTGGCRWLAPRRHRPRPTGSASTTVRYPGGNFVSGYDWEDGVGPRDAAAGAARPRLALDRAQPRRHGRVRGVGSARRRRADARGEPRDPRRGGGTRPRRVLQRARGTRRFADWRAANGHAAPYGIRTWCLGNEMDGPWQIGYTSAAEYGRRAAEAGPRDAPGRSRRSSWSPAAAPGPGCRRFGSWETTVLELAGDVVDHLSLHAYFDPAAYETVDDYLACSADSTG